MENILEDLNLKISNLLCLLTKITKLKMDFHTFKKLLSNIILLHYLKFTITYH